MALVLCDADSDPGGVGDEKMRVGGRNFVAAARADPEMPVSKQPEKLR